MNNEIVRIENVYRSYGTKYEVTNSKNGIEVLKGINLSVKENEFIAIMGKSGCGKTTLLKILGLIDAPTKGKVYFNGKATEKLWGEELADIRRHEIGFIFQDFYLMDSISVKENIMLPMILDKRTDEECIQSMEKLAERFGLLHLLEKKPYELSGGERQRTAICRALINNPQLILADEPTGNLDTKSGQVVIDSLVQIHQKFEKTIIMVTHNPQMASYCEKIFFLKDGMVMEEMIRGETQEVLYQKILEKMKEL